MFKITIEKTEEVISTTGKDWKRVGGSDGDPNYDYTPEIEKRVEVKTEILRQVVDELDLEKVIKAINGIE